MSSQLNSTAYESYLPSGLRDQLLTHSINPAIQRGLEIGALNNPIVKHSNGYVRFIDYASTDTLKGRHSAHSDRIQNMVNVDFIWQGTGSLADIIGERNSFDWIIASHVIEHVPNILGWFRGIAEVLKSGGVFNLAIPDRRFTFDVKCPESTLGQMFDNTYYAKAIDPGSIWNARVNVNSLPAYSGAIAPQLAYDQALRILHEKIYYDSHCWIFTPMSFLLLIEGAISLGLFSFEPIAFTPTQVNDFEFFISLRTPPYNTDATLWKQQQLSAVARMKELVRQQQWVGELLNG